MLNTLSGDGHHVFNEILHTITKRHISKMTSGVAGVLSSLIFSSEFPQRLESVIVSITQSEMGNIWPLAYNHIEEAMNLRETLRTQLQALPPKEFVGTLRPVFQEDEMKLIIVGALLGMIVGFMQQFLIFHWI